MNNIYKRDEPADAKVNSELFKYMIVVTGNINDNSDIKTDKIAVQVKYLSNVWKTLGMSLIVKKILF